MARENDIVLIYYEDEPAGFARIEAIEPDIKKDWYHVKLLLLQVPLQTITWILRDVYINGQEFTMGGNRMRLEKVKAPPEEVAEDAEAQKDEEPGGGEDVGTEEKPPEQPKVVSLKERKKKNGK
jgi:hypothetical protein